MLHAVRVALSVNNFLFRLAKGLPKPGRGKDQPLIKRKLEDGPHPHYFVAQRNSLSIIRQLRAQLPEGIRPQVCNGALATKRFNYKFARTVVAPKCARMDFTVVALAFLFGQKPIAQVGHRQGVGLLAWLAAGEQVILNAGPLLQRGLSFRIVGHFAKIVNPTMNLLAPVASSLVDA